MENNGWKEFLLDDVAKIYSGGTPSSQTKEYWNGEIPWLSSGETSNHFIYDTDKKITQLGVDRSATKLARKNSTVVASAGQGHTRGQTSYLKIDTYVNQSILVFEPKKEMIDSLYLYYNLSSRYEELRQLSDGTSTRGGLSGWIVKRMPIYLPSLYVQKKIVSILGSLDDKIELNNRMSQIFEEQVKHIYDDWFISYGHFNGAKPDGWKKVHLGEFCDCLLGGTPSRKKDSYWNGDIAWINSGEVNNFRITKASEYITQAGLNNSSTKLLPQKTVVIAITGATLGQVSLLEIDTCANQSVVGIVPNENLPYEYLYPLIISKIPELISHQTGGAQQHINNENVKSLEIFIPSRDLLQEYASLVNPMLEQISKNCFENELLSSLRDTLLPKLMSGEIDVEDIEI